MTSPSIAPDGRALRRICRVLAFCVLVASGLSPPLRAQQNRAGPPVPDAPRGFVLEPNTPNPVERSTYLPFYLEDTLFAERDTVRVSMRIYNVLRQVVAIPVTAEDERRAARPLASLPYTEPGRRLGFWDGRDLDGRRVASGIYYVELVVDDARQIGKLIVINPERRRRIIPFFGERGEPE